MYVTFVASDGNHRGFQVRKHVVPQPWLWVRVPRKNMPNCLLRVGINRPRVRAFVRRRRCGAAAEPQNVYGTSLMRFPVFGDLLILEDGQCGAPAYTLKLLLLQQQQTTSPKRMSVSHASLIASSLEEDEATESQ